MFMRYIYRRLSGRKDDVCLYDCIENVYHEIAARVVIHRPIMCQLSSLQTFFTALLRRKMSVVDLLSKKMSCVEKLIGYLDSFVALQPDKITIATCAGSNG